MNKLCEICNGGEHQPGDHPYIPKFEETHNPLDIPFGHEVHEMQEDQLIKVEDGKGATVLDEWGTKEVNNGVKDQGFGNSNNSNEIDEGGMGSGRQPDYGDPLSDGGGPGPLMTFETTPLDIIKEVVDAKLDCPCRKNK
jgi:hypothetical protein